MRQKGWRVATCSMCRGTGLKWSYEVGAVDCRHCNNGVVYISPKGRLALYPGGPFLGSTALEEEMKTAKVLQKVQP